MIFRFNDLEIRFELYAVISGETIDYHEQLVQLTKVSVFTYLYI